MILNKKSTISIILLIISALIILSAIIVGAIHLITQNETLRNIDFILFIVGFVTLIVSNLLKITFKKKNN